MAGCRWWWLLSCFQSLMTTRAWVSDQAVDAEALVADAGIERLGVAVAPGLTGRDEVQAHRGEPSIAAVDRDHWFWRRR
jgi:hypothetical protein